MSRVVISNATPIISFCSVHHEFVLKELFQCITISKAVERELRSADKPGSDFMELDWVQVESPKNSEMVILLHKDLDEGEAETIILAKEMKADVLLIDEHSGYQIANFFGLPAIRTLSVLKTAKANKIIRQVRPVLEEMVQKGRWYSRDLIDKFLRDIGEG